MANVDHPHGLAVIGTMHGGPLLILQMQKDASEDEALFRNDVVIQETDSFIKVAATPGTDLFAGVNLDYGAADTLTDHTIVVDPSAIFDVQDNGDGSGIVEADIGLNCNLAFGAGSAVTKLSGHEVDGSEKATTGTLDVHIIRKIPAQNNDYGQFVRLEVQLNRHRRAPNTAGV